MWPKKQEKKLDFYFSPNLKQKIVVKFLLFFIKKLYSLVLFVECQCKCINVCSWVLCTFCIESKDDISIKIFIYSIEGHDFFTDLVW